MYLCVCKLNKAQRRIRIYLEWVRLCFGEHLKVGFGETPFKQLFIINKNYIHDIV